MEAVCSFGKLDNGRRTSSKWQGKIPDTEVRERAIETPLHLNLVAEIKNQVRWAGKVVHYQMMN